MTDYKSSRIRFEKIDELIRVHDRTRQLILLGNKKYDFMYHDTIKYLISVKSSVTYRIFHNYATIKVDSYYYLPQTKSNDFF